MGSSEKIYETFINPTAAYRSKPFWSWNGILQEDELVRQIKVMQEMGFGGFFMHSRTGLQTEYMGEAWFKMIDVCCREAKRLGMEAWLYDEDRWPSGTCGGMVTMRPEYRQKFIAMDELDSGHFDLVHYGQAFIAAFAVRMENNSLADYYRVTHRLQVKTGYTVRVFRDRKSVV